MAAHLDRLIAQVLNADQHILALLLVDDDRVGLGALVARNYSTWMIDPSFGSFHVVQFALLFAGLRFNSDISAVIRQLLELCPKPEEVMVKRVSRVDVG